MKSMELNTRQRINLSLLLGAQRGTVKDVMLLSKVIEKVDVSDDERNTIGLKVLPTGQVQWEAGAANALSSVKVELEDAEAERVRAVIDEWPQFMPGDTEWLSGIITALR